MIILRLKRKTRNSHEAFGVGPRGGLVASVGSELAGVMELIEGPADMDTLATDLQHWAPSIHCAQRATRTVILRCCFRNCVLEKADLSQSTYCKETETTSSWA